MSNQKRQTIDFDQIVNISIPIKFSRFHSEGFEFPSEPDPDSDMKFLVEILEKIDEQSETRDDR